MKNRTKIIITALLTIWAQFEAVKENGYWGIGGNAIIPILCWLILWRMPILWEENKQEIIYFFKNVEEMEE